MKANGNTLGRKYCGCSREAAGTSDTACPLEVLEAVLTLSIGNIKSAAPPWGTEKEAGALREGKKARATGRLHHLRTGPDLKDNNNNKMNTSHTGATN